jgi:hypothetical protein
MRPLFLQWPAASSRTASAPRHSPPVQALDHARCRLFVTLYPLGDFRARMAQGRARACAGPAAIGPGHRPFRWSARSCGAAARAVSLLSEEAGRTLRRPPVGRAGWPWYRGPVAAARLNPVQPPPAACAHAAQAHDHRSPSSPPQFRRPCAHKLRNSGISRMSLSSRLVTATPPDPRPAPPGVSGGPVTMAAGVTGAGAVAARRRLRPSRWGRRPAPWPALGRGARRRRGGR